MQKLLKRKMEINYELCYILNYNKILFKFYNIFRNNIHYARLAH